MNINPSISILAADDDPFVLGNISLLLINDGYHVVACDSGKNAIAQLQDNEFDIVLTDVKMPKISGIDVLEKVHAVNKETPVILMTAYAELDTAIDAIKKGAYDFIVKPYAPEHLLHSIKKAANHCRLMKMEKNYKQRLEQEVRKKTQELAAALSIVKNVNTEIVHRLTKVSEFRDTDTGAHIKRIGLYCGKIAEILNMPKDFIETIIFASPMHDIGKVGIPDSILLKQGPLTQEEMEIMRRHTTIGQKMLSDSPYFPLQMAARIALSHHEKWDGTGYPQGLKGEEIPIEGRIVILADQYDALRSKRPYKQSLTHKEVENIIINGNERTMPEHFNPKVLKAFIAAAPVFEEIFEAHTDLSADSGMQRASNL